MRQEISPLMVFLVTTLKVASLSYFNSSYHILPSDISLFSYIAGENVLALSPQEGCWTVPSEATYDSAIPYQDTYSRGMSAVYIKNNLQECLLQLFVIAKTWSQTKYPSVRE